MLKLNSIYKNVLVEVVAREKITDAIEGKNVVRIYYATPPRETRGYSFIEPHAYGVSEDGNYVIRAYQTRGVSDSETAGWKLFRVDRIVFFEITDETFNIRPDFNPQDKNMEQILKIVE